MKSLYHCKSCGFISTKRNMYIFFKNILFCIDCFNDYKSNIDPYKRLVEEAIKDKEKTNEKDI